MRLQVTFGWSEPDENGQPITYYQYRLLTQNGGTISGQIFTRMCADGYTTTASSAGSACNNWGGFAGLSSTNRTFTIVDDALICSSQPCTFSVVVSRKRRACLSICMPSLFDCVATPPGFARAAQVRARNSEGNGDGSVFQAFTLDRSPGPLTADGRTKTSLSVSWPAYSPANSSLVSYSLTFDTDAAIVLPTSTTSYSKTGLSPGVEHTFKIQATTSNTQLIPSGDTLTALHDTTVNTNLVTYTDNSEPSQLPLPTQGTLTKIVSTMGELGRPHPRYATAARTCIPSVSSAWWLYASTVRSPSDMR